LVAAGSRVIDLGADFRFRDRARYEAYYGPHPAPDLLPLSVNGYADDPGFAAGEARILGNPGCYPTAFFLAMGPLVRSGVRPGLVLVDGKSGVSGAGRSLRADLMAAEMDANVVAYSTPGGHRHTAEMEGTWGAPVVFQPHLMPMDRGIELTIYWPGAEADPDRVRREWTAFYAGNPFVAVLPEGVMPSTRRVYGTNAAELAVARDGRNGTLVCYVTIDNLGKGAAGQAVQHLNRWMGWPADLGLRVD
ncbi:MAG: Asd/ArgC dimerization domain-containing protein, partial [Firmicutes bacterium]|nr:Asd/ArgC dimerization domain-containing protein [Bacillota bacterium]